MDVSREPGAARAPRKLRPVAGCSPTVGGGPRGRHGARGASRPKSGPPAQHRLGDARPPGGPPSPTAAERIAAVTAHLQLPSELRIVTPSKALPMQPAPLGFAEAVASSKSFDGVHDALRAAVLRAGRGKSLQERWDTVTRHLEHFGRPPWCARSERLAAELQGALEHGDADEQGNKVARAVGMAERLLELLASLRPVLRPAATAVGEALRASFCSEGEEEEEEEEEVEEGTVRRWSRSVQGTPGFQGPTSPVSFRDEVRRGGSVRFKSNFAEQFRQAKASAGAVVRHMQGREQLRCMQVAWLAWRREVAETKLNAVRVSEAAMQQEALEGLQQQLDTAVRERAYWQGRWEVERHDHRRRRESHMEAEGLLGQKAAQLSKHIQHLEAALCEAGEETRSFQTLLDEVCFRDLQGGCTEEMMLQDELLPVVEAWSRGSTSFSPRRRSASFSPRKGESVGGRRLAPLLCEWVNRCLKAHHAGQEFRLDPTHGFNCPAKELGAMMITIYRMAPTCASAADVEAFLAAPPHEAGPDRAQLVISSLCRAGVMTDVDPVLLASERRGCYRMQLLGQLLLRGLDATGAMHAADPRRLLWQSDDDDVLHASLTAHADYLAQEEQQDTPSSKKRKASLGHEEWEPEQLPGRQMPCASWATLRGALADRLGRLCRARRALQLSAQREFQAALQGDDDAPTAGESRDMPRYSAASPGVVDALELAFVRSKGRAAPNVLGTKGAVDGILARNARYLRSVFRFYACHDARRAAGVQQRRMSQLEFDAFRGDCGLAELHSGPCDNELSSIWAAAQQQCDTSPPGLTPELFTDAVVALACLEFDEYSLLMCETPWRRLELLLEVCIMPNASCVSTGEFRHRCNTGQAAALLHSNRPRLTQLFNHYAGGHETHDQLLQTQKELKELSWKEFKQLMDDAGVPGSTVSHLALHQVFTKMQDKDELALTLQELWEVLCAIAVLREPAPYIPLHMKAEAFLDTVFWPALKRKGVLSRMTQRRATDTQPSGGRRRSSAAAPGAGRRSSEAQRRSPSSPEQGQRRSVGRRQSAAR